MFDFPSLGAFMPPVIKAKKFDEANGLDIMFDARPPDAYTVQFNSGEYKLGGSAAVLTVGLADVRGVKVKYLFNLFDYWAGRHLAARNQNGEGPRGQGARRRPGDNQLSNVRVLRQEARRRRLQVQGGQHGDARELVSYAIADRADAVQLWEPAYTILKSEAGRALHRPATQKTWKAFAGGSAIPYLGIAAHTDWIEQNPDAVKKLYATYKAAADYIVKNPDEAAKIINPRGTPDDHTALVSLIKANERLGMNVKPAGEIKKEIEAVYKAGVDVGFLQKTPTNDTIYDKPLQ